MTQQNRPFGWLYKIVFGFVKEYKRDIWVAGSDYAFGIIVEEEKR